MWCCTSRRLCHVDDFVFNLQEEPVSTSTSLRNLGAFFDQPLLLTNHVNRLMRSCYYQLRRIKSVRRALPTVAEIQLVNSFIISRVDYCNSILAAAPSKQLDRVQSVLNVAARLIYGRGALRTSVRPHPRQAALAWSPRKNFVQVCPSSVQGATRPDAPLHKELLSTDVVSPVPL